MSIKSETIYRSEGFEFRLITDFVKWPDGTTRPVCQVCYSKNELFVCTRDKHMPIAVFDMEGNFKRSFGESLPFNRTHGLFVNKDEELFVCDDGRHVVYKLDIYGNLLQTFGELDKHCDNGYDITVEWPHDLYTIKRAGEPFNRPTKMIEAPNGDLYCSDGYGNVSIHRFDKNGTLKKTWGGHGHGNGEFILPHSLWAAPDNRIWVCDREGFRVEIFDENGEYLDQIAKLATPADIWGDGEYVYIGLNEGGILIYDLDRNLKAVIGYKKCPLRAHSITGDDKGSLYIGLLSGDSSVYKLERL